MEQEHAPTGGEHAADAHGAAAEHSVGFPPFDQADTFPSQIFWLVVTFGLLYFAAAFWLIPAARKIVADRENSIAKDVAEAAAASQKADAAAKALETRIGEARARSRDTSAKARADADRLIAAESTKSETATAARQAEAEKRVAETRAKAMANVPQVAEDAVAAIAEKLAGVKPDAAAVKRAVAGALGR